MKTVSLCVLLSMGFWLGRLSKRRELKKVTEERDEAEARGECGYCSAETLELISKLKKQKGDL